MYDLTISVRGGVRSCFFSALALAAIGCGDDTHAKRISEGDDGPRCVVAPCALPTTNLEVKPEDVIVTLPSEPSATAPTSVPPSAVCASEVIEAKLSPVNLFLMVDRSGSMSQRQKWRQAVGALRSFLTDPDTAGLRVALRFFSDDEPMAGCTMQGCSIDACAEPLVQAGTLSKEVGVSDAQETQLVDALNRTFPRSGLGTPIYPALGGALQWASTYRSDHPDERAVVVLVTDGEPNGCDQDIGDISALAASAVANFDIPTYAIGLEGSNEAQLDQIARAGQTQQGIFIGANHNAEAALLDALTTIRGQTMSCDFAVPKAPSGQAIDPNQVNVNLAREGGSVDLFRVDSAADCRPDVAAWYYDDPAAPGRIHLCPAACESAGQAADVSVAMGCVESRRDPRLAR